MYTYIQHILIIFTSNSAEPPPTHPLPSMHLLLYFFITHWIQLILAVCTWVWGYPVSSMGNLLVATSLKGKWLFPQQRNQPNSLAYEPLSHLCWHVAWWPCAGTAAGNWSVTAMSYPEDSPSWQSCPLFTLSLPPLWWSLSLRSRCWSRCPSQGWTLNSHSYPLIGCKSLN